MAEQEKTYFFASEHSILGKSQLYETLNMEDAVPTQKGQCVKLWVSRTCQFISLLREVRFFQTLYQRRFLRHSFLSLHHRRMGTATKLGVQGPLQLLAAQARRERAQGQDVARLDLQGIGFLQL